MMRSAKQVVAARLRCFALSGLLAVVGCGQGGGPAVTDGAATTSAATHEITAQATTQSTTTTTLPAAVTETDLAVLTAAIEDLATQAEAEFLWVHDGRTEAQRTKVALFTKTGEASGLSSGDQITSELRMNKAVWMPPPGLLEDHTARNRESVSLDAMRGRSQHLVLIEAFTIEDAIAATQPFDRAGWWEKHVLQLAPEAKVIASSCLPGYSTDGQHALVRMSVGPSAHGASVTYLLEQRDGRWTVVRRKFAFYV